MKYKLSDIALKGNKQADDILATLDLLNVKYHSNITVTFSRARRGHANNKRIIMPIHTIDNTFSNEYGIYYLIHEFAHTQCIKAGIYDHGKRFKKLEKLLLDLFGLQIEYKKAYPAKLYAYGNMVYESKPFSNKQCIHTYSRMVVKNGIKSFYCIHCNKKKPD